MSFQGFTETDFHVFTIPGLEARMEALKATIRPKLEALGSHFTPILTAETGDEMYSHVAKHARRTVHPPSDTWVAWASSKRGYKMLPHFQVGLWETHLFIWFALIYESPIKPHFADNLAASWRQIKTEIPANYVWSFDHTQPGTYPHADMNDEKMEETIHRLKNVKKSEILCGITLDRHDSSVSDGHALLSIVEQTFQTLKPLYLLCR
ncbi:YktB family protein [Aneurinibacillus terranovensis]|uniref:YktB family protein n=1 Tax=Aneurinibacillus terranovensis TaxID=278991 RepID=UPI00041B04E3|nr:DUF1054 domain-containing protein [Aneurinibacillus terranovensis]